MHNAPAADQRPETDGGLAGDHHPERHIKIVAEMALREQQNGDDAHVFCASLPPWPSEISDAAPNCSHSNVGSTVRGLARLNAHDTVSTRSNARKKPNSGESTMKAPVVKSPGHTIELSPALATPAPTSPPISACELLEGMPYHQVTRFQEMAPTRAPKITCASITSADTMPTPTVRATWTPKTRNAMKLKKAAQITA